MDSCTEIQYSDIADVGIGPWPPHDGFVDGTFYGSIAHPYYEANPTEDHFQLYSGLDDYATQPGHGTDFTRTLSYSDDPATLAPRLQSEERCQHCFESFNDSDALRYTPLHPFISAFRG
jgi:hypothetical protein